MCELVFIPAMLTQTKAGLATPRWREGATRGEEMASIEIPKELLPSDGRFGSGPSKVRPEALAALIAEGPGYIGTSHRQAPVKNMVGRVRDGLRDFFSPPDGYEVLLGNGGATAFWDLATFCLIDTKSQHLSFGEFSSKFAAAAQATAHLKDPEILLSEAGTHPEAIARQDIDAYGLTQNETTTGVAMSISRPRHDDGTVARGLVLVDATSGAGALRIDLAEADAYYFSPQKSFGSDGGLWIALCSPGAMQRSAELGASGRSIPASIDLNIAIKNSLANQTYNTPALVTLFLLANQVEWFNENGGLEWAASRCDESSAILYGWAEKTSYTTPFAQKPSERSHVVGTIDFDESVDAEAIAKVLRAHNVVDIEPYRTLGRNQLRIAMFPNVEPSDIEALTTCIDYVIERL